MEGGSILTHAHFRVPETQLWKHEDTQENGRYEDGDRSPTNKTRRKKRGDGNKDNATAHDTKYRYGLGRLDFLAERINH